MTIRLFVCSKKSFIFSLAMALQKLANQISGLVELSEEDLTLIGSKFKFRSFKQKDYLLREGAISSEIHFIVTGLVRVFYIRNDKETTTYLACDNGFVSSYASFINQTKSIEFIQCLENTETLSISYNDMQSLYELIPSWEKVGRIIAEKNVLCLSDRLLKLQAIPAKEKYEEFLLTSPQKIIQRTPLLHIASFLGITPESLSRIRKGIS